MKKQGEVTAMAAFAQECTTEIQGQSPISAAQNITFSESQFNGIQSDWK